MKESFSPHKNSTGSQFAIEKEYWSNKLAGEVKKMSNLLNIDLIELWGYNKI